jgi:hypothetical protein
MDDIFEQQNINNEILQTLMHISPNLIKYQRRLNF